MKDFTLKSLESLREVLTEPRESISFAACVTSAEYHDRLRDKFRSIESRPIPLRTTSVFGIRLVEKPGQIAAAWMFSDEKIMQAYLDGKLTEEDLKRMIHPRICQKL
jgi:hypothetical protein